MYRPRDFASYILGIFICNLLLYLAFYIIMKVKEVAVADMPLPISKEDGMSLLSAAIWVPCRRAWRGPCGTWGEMRHWLFWRGCCAVILVAGLHLPGVGNTWWRWTGQAYLPLCIALAPGKHLL